MFPRLGLKKLMTKSSIENYKETMKQKYEAEQKALEENLTLIRASNTKQFDAVKSPRRRETVGEETMTEKASKKLSQIFKKKKRSTVMYESAFGTVRSLTSPILESSRSTELHSSENQGERSLKKFLENLPPPPPPLVLSNSESLSNLSLSSSLPSDSQTKAASLSPRPSNNSRSSNNSTSFDNSSELSLDKIETISANLGLPYKEGALNMIGSKREWVQYHVTFLFALFPFYCCGLILE